MRSMTRTRWWRNSRGGDGCGVAWRPLGPHLGLSHVFAPALTPALSQRARELTGALCIVSLFVGRPAGGALDEPVDHHGGGPDGICTVEAVVSAGNDDDLRLDAVLLKRRVRLAAIADIHQTVRVAVHQQRRRIIGGHVNERQVRGSLRPIEVQRRKARVRDLWAKDTVKIKLPTVSGSLVYCSRVSQPRTGSHPCWEVRSGRTGPGRAQSPCMGGDGVAGHRLRRRFAGVGGDRAVAPDDSTRPAGAGSRRPGHRPSAACRCWAPAPPADVAGPPGRSGGVGRPADPR